MQKISIGITAYNRNKLLKRAIISILNQSHNNFEILVGNDYIKKKITLKTLNIFDRRIKIFNHKKNLGEVENMNFLLNKSKYKWFSWLADDDFLEKNYLEELLNNIKKFKNKNIVASYSNYRRVINDKKKIISNKNEPILYDKTEFIKNYSSQVIRLIGVYGLLNTKILKKVQKKKKLGKSIKIDGKPSGVYAFTDTMLPIRLSEYGNIVWHDKKLVNLDLRFGAISKYTKDYISYFSSHKDAFNLLIKIVEKLKDEKIKIKIYKNFLNKIMFNKIDLLKRNKNLNIFEISKLFLRHSFNLFNKLTVKKKIILMTLIIKYYIIFLTRNRQFFY